jgi:hypothetical protein
MGHEDISQLSAQDAENLERRAETLEPGSQAAPGWHRCDNDIARRRGCEIKDNSRNHGSRAGSRGNTRGDIPIAARTAIRLNARLRCDTLRITLGSNGISPKPECYKLRRQPRSPDRQAEDALTAPSVL